MAVEVTRKDTLPPCALKIVCYNADTRRNNLSPKGLPVIRAQLFRNLRSICLIAAVLALGVPEISSAAPTTVKKPVATKRAAATAKVGGEGSFDYVYADAAARRLYIPRGARVTVFNLDTRARRESNCLSLSFYRSRFFFVPARAYRDYRDRCLGE